MMKSNAKDTIHRLQQSRFGGEPLLPLLLNDPNLHAATDSAEFDSFHSRSNLRDAVTASVFQNYTKISTTPTRAETEKTPDTRDSSTLRRLLKNLWCPQAKTCAQLLDEENRVNYLATGYAQ
ncbi:hypothetical protein D915_008190 [Fasciola hepatica]|uniref:Uncharacterized protein n=1 Tax=Fasciola hepatica TaxID=6192 RepID=A0A4E0R2X8_FASHE|nr:hypothetical protein D915_008190 [Fasciola hepatica]